MIPKIRILTVVLMLSLTLAGWFGALRSSCADSETSSQDVWVDAAVNTTVVYVGQTFHYTLTAGIKNGTVTLPGARVLWPSCRLLHYQESDVSDRHEGYRAMQGQYTLMALGLRTIEFPPLSVKFAWPEGTTATAQTAVHILKTASRNPQGMALRNPRPPQSSAPVWYFIVLSAVLLIISFLWLDFVRFRKRVPRQRPAHLTAYHKLETLGRSRIVMEGRVDRYFIELSRVLRQYVADRYTLPALEWPRREILQALCERGVSPRVRRWLNSVLIQADLVKFAKTWAEFSTIAVAQRRARLFIDATRPLDKKAKVKKKKG